MPGAGVVFRPATEKPAGPTFEGTFSAQFGPRTTVQGTEVADTGVTVTWVTRSACSDAGCVATATEVAPPDDEDPRPPNMVFDNVDGRWVSVRAVPSQCLIPNGQTIDVEGWQAYSLTPRPDGSLVGTYTNRSSVGGACHSSTQSVTVTRTADADPSVQVGRSRGAATAGRLPRCEPVGRLRPDPDQSADR